MNDVKSAAPSRMEGRGKAALLLTLPRAWNTARFVVHDRATGTTVNLASGFNAYGAADRLRIMQPYVRGTLPMAEGGDTDRDPLCLSAKAQLLSPADRAQMAGLLRAREFRRLGE
jgi:hypothetical protein